MNLSKTAFITEGVLFVILGVLALILPQMFSLAVGFVLAWLLIVGGIVKFVNSFQHRERPDFRVALILSLVYFLGGIYFLASPLKGLVALTILLGMFFLVEGAVKIIWSLELRHYSRWGTLLLSGIVALLLGGLILAGIPVTAVFTLGLFLGIDLLIFGFSLIVLGLEMPRLGKVQ